MCRSGMSRNHSWQSGRLLCFLCLLFLRSFCRLADVRRLGLLDMRWTCGLVKIVVVFVLVIIVPVVGFLEVEEYKIRSRVSFFTYNIVA
jgi:nitrogen fixation/metabolism regulation signal transduction histidine kinase